jgi:hypothetical protein
MIKYNSKLFVDSISLFFIFSFIYLINKGFDFSDEGFYALNFAKDQEIGKSITYFGLIFKKFGFSIIELRFIRLFLALTACFVLSTGFLNLIEFKKINITNPRLVGSIINLLLLYPLFVGPKMISYNHISNYLSYIILGLIFWSVNLSNNKRSLLYFIMGACFYFVFLSKFTTFFVVLFLIILSSFIFTKSQLLFFKLINIVFLFLGFFITSYIFGFFSGFSLLDISLNILECVSEINKLSQNAHSSNSIFLSQLNIIKVTILLFSISLFTILPIVKFSHNEKMNKVKISIILLYLTLYIFLLAYFLGGDKILDIELSKTGFFQFISNLYPGFIPYLLIIIFFVALLYYCVEIKQFPNNILEAAICILFSFGIIIGTDNNIYIAINTVLTSLFLGLILLSSNNFFLKNTLFLKSLSVLSIVYLVSSFSFYLYIFPYGVKIFYKLNVKSNLENLKGISLSEDSNDLLSEVNDCLVKNNFRMGDFIFGYGYGVNGIIYSIGGIYPNAILFNSSPYTNIYQKNLRYSEIQEKERLFVIIDNNYISRMESFLEVLESVDLKFDNSNLIQLVKHSSGTTYNIYLISKNQKN